MTTFSSLKFARHFFGTLAVVSALALQPTLHAQNQAFEQIAPKQPPATGEGKVVNEAEGKAKGVNGASEVVVAEKLKGVVLVSDPKQVRSEGVKGQPGINAGNITFANEADFRAILEPYLEHTATLKSLAEMTRAMIGYYRDHDRPVVNIYLPQQTVENGTVQIVVLETRVGKVNASGAKWFSNDSLRHSVSLRPNQPITSSDIRDTVDWTNRNPFLSADVLLAPGDTAGTTDVMLRVHDRFPLRPYVGYEDSGNLQTGFDRYFAGFNYGNLFGLGQQLNYQYTISGDGTSLRAHSGSYVIPLPWHHILTFFGSYADTKGDVPPLIHLVGRSYQISGRYAIPLPTFAVGPVIYRHEFGAGFDYKYNNNSLQFGGTPAGGSLYDIDQYVMSYNGTETDPYGRLTIDDQLYVSPGGWGGNNNDAAFEEAHAGAASNYVYNALVLERLTKLPGDWSLLLRGTVQTSNDNLAPSEQLGFGGYDTVRGYDEREVNADEGYIFTTEVRAPPISIGDLAKFPALKDQLQFLAFWDCSTAYNHAPLPGEASETSLSSVGVGLRYSINTYLSVRYDYGFQLTNTGLDKDHGNRSDLGIVASY